MDYLTLDVNGVILAFVLAFIMLYVATFSEPTIVMGWTLGLFYVITMLYFLAISAVVTRFGERYKMSIRQYQKTRGVKNVIANGLGPLVFVILIFFVVNSQYSSLAFIAGFIASVAAVTSDKFSSEIGVLDGTPISIVTAKKVRKGESGGVTLLGLGAGFVGAFIVALVIGSIYLLLLPPAYGCPASGCGKIPNIAAFALIASVTLGGFVGTIVDSLLGYFEERGVGSKYTTNFICSIFGGLFGILIYFIMFNALVA